MFKTMLVCFALFAGQTEYPSREPIGPNGEQISAPIPVEMHQENTGGSDGAGLCVIASLKTVGEYLGWDFDPLWKEAQRRPGGYYVEKLDELLLKEMPDLPYAHYIGSDYQVLVNMSQSGLPVGVTMDTGDLYNGQPIRHMVTGVEFNEETACHVDNNRPGFYVWTTSKEWIRRLMLNDGKFWAVAIGPNDSLNSLNLNHLLIVGAVLGLGIFLRKPKLAI